MPAHTRHAPPPCLILCLLLWTCGCANTRCSHRPSSPASARTTRPASTAPSTAGSPADQPAPAEPVIRIRIERNIARLTLDGPPRLMVSNHLDQRLIVPTPLDLTRIDGRWFNHNQPLEPLAGSARLSVQPLAGDRLTVNGQPYPGSVGLLAVSPATFDVINHIGIETYLPGVLEHELYDRWPMATYQALAIAARSYALACMNDSRYRPYDVEDTTASQAYAGLTSNDKAHQAVRDTRGVVLAYHNQVLKAYYSSTCGGAGLSPTQAFGVPGPPPLTPARPCPWCKHAPYRDWGPIVRQRNLLARRLAGFGQVRRLPLAQLQAIVDIRIAQRNKWGRPVWFTVTDQNGKAHPLRPETFRNACNFHDPALGLPPPPRGLRLPSSFFQVRLDARKVIFYNGHGLGHGVGLCQYGANAMARQGRDPLDILRFYYPGADIDRAY